MQEDQGSHHTARNTDLLESCPLRRIAAKLYISMRGIYDGPRACQCFNVHATSRALTGSLRGSQVRKCTCPLDFDLYQVIQPWAYCSSTGVTTAPSCPEFYLSQVIPSKHWPAERCHEASIGMGPSSEHSLPRRKSFVIQRLSRIAVIELSSFK